MKIDSYAHIIPPKFKDTLLNSPRISPAMKKNLEPFPALFDLGERFRIMDRHSDVVQVLTLAGASVDEIAGQSKEAIEFAQRVNDEMAELVFKYPDRFAAAAAVLPMSDMDAALKELDRAVNELNLRGVLLRTPIGEKPVDRPEFMPLYERMCSYNLPIWFHPQSRADKPDYADETESKYRIWHVWRIIYESTVAMTRLIFSGIIERYPNLKIIIHHCGAMVPYFSERITLHYHIDEMRSKLDVKRGLTKPIIAYFRRFYVDTAIVGNAPALMCAYKFYGADHMLFGTDVPFDPQLGDYSTRHVIEAIEQMDIADSDKKKIFEENARELMRLPV